MDNPPERTEDNVVGLFAGVMKYTVGSSAGAGDAPVVPGVEIRGCKEEATCGGAMYIGSIRFSFCIPCILERRPFPFNGLLVKL